MIRWKIAQWFELNWWKNYLRDKNKKEYLEWKKNYWRDIFSKIEIPIDSSKTICDLGCGPTGVFIALTENKILAVDPLINEYENVVPLFRKRDYPNTIFVQNTMEEFNTTKLSPTTREIASQSLAMTFDFVFCMNAINHVHDIEKGFDKLKEVCSDNGAIILSVDAHNFSFFKHLFRLVPADILHPHQYDLNEYKSLLEERGMKILKTELLKKEFFFNHYLIVAK